MSAALAGQGSSGDPLRLFAGDVPGQLLSRLTGTSPASCLGESSILWGELNQLTCCFVLVRPMVRPLGELGRVECLRLLAVGAPPGQPAQHPIHPRRMRVGLLWRVQQRIDQRAQRGLLGVSQIVLCPLAGTFGSFCFLENLCFRHRRCAAP